MKKRFRPRLENLEQRQLLAGDVDFAQFVDLPTKDDFAPEVVRQLTDQELLAVNIGWVFQGSPVSRDGDFLISHYGKKVEVAMLDPAAPGGARVTDVFEGSTHESEALGVHIMGSGRLLINSTVTTGWLQQETTTWFMKIEDDGTLTVLDTLEQTWGTKAWIRDDGLTLMTTLGESERLPASVADFPVFETMLDDSSRDTYLIQNYVFENDRLELQTAIQTNRGILSAFPGDDGRVLISDLGVLHIVTPTRSGQTVSEVAIPGGMTNVNRLTTNDDGTILFEGTFPSPGGEFGFRPQWGTVQVDANGDVVDVWKEQGRLYSGMRSRQFNPGFPGRITPLNNWFRNKEDGVRILSMVDDQFVVDSEISLPGVSGSKAGGIRIDEDRVIIVGGDYAKFKEETLQARQRQHLDLTAHLLVRDESGEFTLRDSFPLNGLHFNSTAQVSDGVVTLADNNHVYILRSDTDRLTVEHIEGDGQGASRPSITGLQNVNVSFDGRSVKYSLPGETVNRRDPLPAYDFSATQLDPAVADQAVTEFAEANEEVEAPPKLDFDEATGKSRSETASERTVLAEGREPSGNAPGGLRRTANNEVSVGRFSASRLEAEGEPHDTDYSPWTNPLDPADTNGDGHLTAVDALIVINQLNRSDVSELADINAPPILAIGETEADAAWHLDTTGDGYLSPRDALVVINRLNRQETSGEGESVRVASSTSGENLSGSPVEFDNDFARVGATLDGNSAVQRFVFTATLPRVSVDLNSLADESLAIVRVFDAEGVVIASSVDQPSRSRFEGFDFATRAGGEYIIEVSYADANASDDFEFALSIFQFEPARWLPTSSDEITVVEGPDGGDLADTIAEASDVPIRTIGSSFSQSLERPGDVDVIRLPNALPGSVFVSGLGGIAFELLTHEGQVLQRQSSGMEVRERTDVGYYTDGQTANFPFVYLRIFSTENATGEYQVSVLFDGHGENATPQPNANRIIESYDANTAEELTFVDGQVTAEGSTDGRDAVQFYRFSTNEERIELSLSATQGTMMQLFLEESRSPSGQATTDSVVTRFLGPPDGRERAFVLAIWNPDGPSQFEVQGRLFSPNATPIEVDAATLATAVPFPQPSSDQFESNIRLTAGDVDYYRFTAKRDDTVVYATGYPDRDEAVLSLEIDILDSRGRRVAAVIPPNANWEDIQALLYERGIQIEIGETTIGEEYFLRIANPLSTEIQTRVLIH